ncbi:hypothetical protein KQI84_09445 [bacterium]|nr:hypothetical protein [bacterium]
MNRISSKIMACLALFVVATVSTAFAGATLSTSLVTPPASLAPGQQFTIHVAVTANDTATTPAHAALRFQYDTADVTFISASGDANDGWLGTVDAGAIGAEEVVSGSVVTRDIPTLGNFSNTSLTPDVMDLVFEMTATPASAVDITFEMDPGAASPLIDVTASPITVDATTDTATQGLFPYSSVAEWRQLDY